MSDTYESQRNISVPARGTRVCLIIGVLFLVAAGYFLLAPVQVGTGTAKSFNCGTALNGPSSQFGKGICGAANDVALRKAEFLGVAALVVVVGGFLTYGLDRRMQTVPARRTRPTEPDDDE